MAFEYITSTEGGKIEKGRSNFASKDSVIQDLESKGLVVISVEEVRDMKASAKLGAVLAGTISHVEIVLFTKHLSIMLKAGLTLVESLEILRAQSTTWRMRTVLAGVKDHVEGGGRFSDALSDHPKIFSSFYVNIIRVGEVAGTLDENLTHLATQYTKDYELRRRVKTALLYPTIVIIAALFIGFFFATYVLPQISQLFIGLKGVELPLVTRILLAVAKFSKEHTVSMFFGIFGGVSAILWLVKQSFAAPVTHLIILRTPILGRIVQNVNLARFSLVFGTLLRSGVDITAALKVTSEVLGNIYYKAALARALGEVRQGGALSAALIKNPALFPPITSKMVGVGESAGKLEDVLVYLSEFYELEVDATMRNLSVILEPVMLLFIGGLALAMAFAILIPIYNFISAISTI